MISDEERREVARKLRGRLRELSHAVERAGKAFGRAHKSFQRMLPRGERIRYRNRQRAIERSRRNNESRGRG